MVILVVFNSFNVVKNLKKPDPVARQMTPLYTTVVKPTGALRTPGHIVSIIIVTFSVRHRLFIFRLTILHLISVIIFHGNFTVTGVVINFIFVAACYRG